MDEKIIVLEEEVEIIEEIEMDEATEVTGDSGARHNTLVDRNDADSHEICAISGLRAELDKIETPRVIESNIHQQADYYKWQDENNIPTYPIGRFVSLYTYDVVVDEETTTRNGTGNICLCDGTMDVFGVTVEGAGFVGNQVYTALENGTKIGRDGKCNLVAHSGVVAVQKQTDVAVGDYVVPDAFGKAKKVESGKHGYLVTGLSDLYGEECAVISLSAPSTVAQQVSDTLYNAEAGLVVRMSAAEANIITVGNKANDAYALALEAKAGTGGNGEVTGDIKGEIDRIDGEIGNLNTSVTNANTVAAEAKVIADSAVSSAESIKDEAVQKANEALNEVSSTRNDLEAKINEVNTDLDNTNLELQATKGDFDSTINNLRLDTEGQLADFKKEVSDNYATTIQLATVKTEASDAIAAIKQEASDTYATIESVTSLETETSEAIAGFKQEASETYATQEMLTAYKNDTSEALALYKTEVTENYATQEMVTTLETNTSKALADYKQKVTNTYATQEMVTKLETEASDALTDYKQEVSETYATNTSLAQLQTDTTNAIATSEEKATETYARKTDLTSYEGKVNTAMTSLKQQSDDNGARIEALVTDIDKYSVGEYSQAYNLTWEQAKSILREGMIHIPTTTHEETYEGYDEVNKLSDETYSDTQKFIREYYYTWDGEKWNPSSSRLVSFSSDYVAGTEGKYWVVTLNDVTKDEVTYDLGGLYLHTEGTWMKVASIADNTLARAISDVRQTANSISATVKNVKDDVATLDIRVEGAESKIQTITTWEDRIATIEQKAGDNESSIALVVAEKDGDKVVNTASITTAITEDKSSIALLADNITLNADRINFDVDDYQVKASKIDFDTEQYVIDANHIDLSGVLSISSKKDFVSSVEIFYARSSSAVTFVATTDWNKIAPEWAEGEYMWQKTISTYADHTEDKPHQEETMVCIQGARGSDGKGVNIKGVAYTSQPISDDTVGTSTYNIYSDSSYQTQITNPADSDAYLIDGYLFVYSGTENYFSCVGKIQGPAGYTPIKGVDYFDGSKGDDGVSIVWKGTYTSAPSNPENGWAYYNSTAKASYVYQDGWYQMSIDGVNGQKGDAGTSIVWKGELSAPPTTPQENWVYKDSDDGIVYIYNGTGWEPMVLDGNDGADGTDGQDGLSVFITYNDSVETPNVPSGDGTSDGWHTDATSNVVWMSQKVAADASSGSWGDPIKIKGESGDAPIIGANGNWFIGGIDTGIKAEGSDGDTPTIEINEDGYWVINGEVSEVKALGSDGSPGIYITEIIEQYYLSSSAKEPSDGEWINIVDNSTIPVEKSKYRFRRQKYIWSDHTTEKPHITYSVARLDETDQRILEWCMDTDSTKIDGSKIYTGTIKADQIDANAITSDKIDAGAITSDKIDAGAITAGKIAAGAVTADEIDVIELSAITGNMGALTSGVIQSPNYGEIQIWLANENQTIESSSINKEESVITYFNKTIGTEGLKFTLINNDTEYEVSGYEGSVLDVIIPSVYEEKPVTSIGASAFHSNSLTSVVIPNSVTSIGRLAFGYCKSLTSIVILSGVTSIGELAFTDCHSLKSIEIPASVTSIGNQAFYECGLNTVIFAEGSKLESIGSYAFEGCDSLTSIEIPNSVKSIGEGVFCKCQSLVSITIPFVGAKASVTSSDTYQYPLGYIFGTRGYAWDIKVTQEYRGSNINSVTSSTYYMPSSLKSVTVTGGNILYGAFYNCSSLMSITIPDSVTSIGEDAFYNCTSLTSIEIPDGVTSIGYAAFKTCSSLTSVQISASVTSIEAYAVSYCDNLKTVIFAKGSKLDCISNSTFAHCPSLTSIEIPYGVTSIGNSAFHGCDSLASIEIPDSVTSIGSYAFYDCASLTSIEIPNSVESIGYRAFSGCSSLESITLPFVGASDIEEENTNFGYIFGAKTYSENSEHVPQSLHNVVITDIGNFTQNVAQYAFYGCSNLQSVILPDSVTNIGSGAFSGCSSLNHITIPFVGSKEVQIADIIYPFGYIFGTINYDGGTSTEQYYYNKETQESISVNYYIPKELKSVEIINDDKIYDGAFKNCSSLTTIILSSSIKSIGKDAFIYCNGLTKVNYLGTIDGWAQIEFGSSIANPLYYAKKLYIKDEFVMGAVLTTATKINAYAFYNCTSLTSIEIPASVTSIGEDVFFGCVTSFVIYCNFFEDEKPDGWCENWNRGHHVFWLEKNDDEFIFLATKPDASEYSIKGYQGNSTEITLPNSYKDKSVVIGKRAFYNYKSLTNITIPDGIVSIGDYAFNGCSSLTQITISKNIKIVGKAAFSSALDTVVYTGTIDEWTQIGFGNRYANPLYYSANLYINGELVTQANITTVTKISNYAFAGYNSLTSVVIGDSVTSIGDEAFESCTNLTNIKMSVNINSIGQDAFQSIKNAISVSYDNYANNWAAINFGNNDANPLHSGGNITFKDKDSSQICIWQDINAYAFYGCASIKKVEFKYPLTTINESAFYNCDNLTSVVFNRDYYDYNKYNSDNIIDVQIKSNAFANCDSLTTITIPKKISCEINSLNFPKISAVYYQGKIEDKTIENVDFANLLPNNTCWYYYSEYSPEDSSNNYWAFSKGFRISCEDDYMIDSPNFKITHEGVVNAVDANLSGTITTSKGYIGALEITTDGVRGKDNCFVLTDEGLKTNKIDIAGCSLYTEDDKTYINSNGQLYIQNQNGLEDLEEREFSMKLYRRCTDNSGWIPQVEFWIELQNNAVRLLYEKTYIVYFTIKSGNKITADSSVSLTIPAGDYKSQKRTVIQPNGNVFKTDYINFTINGKSTGDLVMQNPYPGYSLALSDFDTFTQKSCDKAENNITFKGNLVPSDSTVYSIGTENIPWNVGRFGILYSDSGSVNKSDKNLKNTINNLSDAYSMIFDDLRPVTFKYDDGTSDRLHTGFIAQEVRDSTLKAGLTTKDFAAYCEWEKEDGTTTCGLRYSEFIALCVDQIQKLKVRVAELEDKLQTQQNDYSSSNE